MNTPCFVKGKEKNLAMNIYFVWVQRINFSKRLSVLTTTLHSLISKQLLKTSSLKVQ